ncbi:FAD-dependent oxidoreductase, partial [Salmonella enterica subsp. enterica serovar Braenderup]
TYVRALRQRWDVDERLSSPVRSVTRQGAQVAIDSNRGLEHFDHLVMACHSDQALALLSDPSERERDILGAMPYQAN